MSKIYLMPYNKECHKKITNECEKETNSQTNSFIKANMIRNKRTETSNKNNKDNSISLKFLHWNANSLNNKINEFKSIILEAIEPDVVSINETKLSEFRANMLLNFDNYNTVHKARSENTNGAGGVAILIHKKLSYHVVKDEILEGIECIAVNIFIKNVELLCLSYYNPPQCQLNVQKLTEIQKKYKNIIICGDLNAKNVNLGCKNNNSNGTLLEDLLLNTNLLVVNNADHTYHRLNDNNSDILDWCLVSHNMHEAFKSFKVLHENLVDSDHYPIQIELQFNKKEVQFQELNNDNGKKKFNYKKANWSNFSKDLEIVSLDHIDFLSLDQLNYFLTNELTKAIEKNIPEYNLSNKTKLLPEYVVNMIKQRKLLKSKIKNKKMTTEELRKTKSEYNFLKKLITEEINALENSKWKEFMKKIGKNPTSCAPFWRKINLHKSRQNSIKTLIYENKIFHSSAEKADLFADIMSATFNNNKSNDEEETETITKRLKERIEKYKKEKKTEEIVDKITINELDKALSDLNNKTSSGLDGICNLVLKKLPQNLKLVLLKLFNKTISESKIPNEWKLSEITMIPKKNIDLENPKSYRPISMTSCVAKLCEKLILSRIKKFLKENKVIIKQQSGFREHRQTKDNLVFLLQKIQESFARKKKVLGFFFDISQAFDKVWHEGLIIKLIKIKMPIYIIKWLQYYLEDRKFCIKVDNNKSEFRDIRCGVPQGAVLSPTLFSIFINDIPSLFEKNKEYSLLFADDLVTIFIFKRHGKLEAKVTAYMKRLEKWLNEWKLQMHPKKCNSIVFNAGSRKSLNKNFNFKLNSEFIPTCETIKFLGLTFDIGLNFNEHVKDIKKKCNNRLNVIKILSNTKWRLNKTTLTTIYLALIRSVIDYSSLIMPHLAKTLTKTIQSVQNTAFKCIYKLDYKTSTEEVVKISGVSLISTRANELNIKYIKNCAKFDNLLIKDLINEYLAGSKIFKTKTFLCIYKDTFLV